VGWGGGQGRAAGERVHGVAVERRIAVRRLLVHCGLLRGTDMQLDLIVAEVRTVCFIL